MQAVRKAFLLAAAAVAVVAAAHEPARAVPIGGFSAVGSLQLDADEIQWLPIAGGSENALVTVPTSGSFVGLEGTGAVLTDLDLVTPPLGGILLTFVAAPTLSLTLTSLPGGPFGAAQCAAVPAAGQTCTPTDSPLSFVNFATGGGLSSLVSFVVGGTASDGAGSAPFSGVFTAQFIGLPYQSVLAALAGGGTVTTSYSASLEVVPEPATLALLGAALAALALGRRRL